MTVIQPLDHRHQTLDLGGKGRNWNT